MWLLHRKVVLTSVKHWFHPRQSENGFSACDGFSLAAYQKPTQPLSPPSQQAREGDKMKTTWVSFSPSRSLLTLLSPWVTLSPYTAGMGLWPVLLLLTYYFCYTMVFAGAAGVPCLGSCCFPHPSLPGCSFCTSLHRCFLGCSHWLCPAEGPSQFLPQEILWHWFSSYIMSQTPCVSVGKAQLQLLPY